jgi:hypothetical protein
MRVSPAGIGALGAAVLVAVVCVSVHYGRNDPVSLMSECVPLPPPPSVFMLREESVETRCARSRTESAWAASLVS